MPAGGLEPPRQKAADLSPPSPTVSLATQHCGCRCPTNRPQKERAAEAAPSARRQDQAASGGSGRGSQLLRLCGIGPEFASVLSLEAFYRDFANRREVAAYSGLTPSPWKSGGIDAEQGISKAGIPTTAGRREPRPARARQAPAALRHPRRSEPEPILYSALTETADHEHQ
jgi:Transposase IS116/IS110/IS902 family